MADTRNFGGRLYLPVDTSDAREGDVIEYTGGRSRGRYTRRIKRLARSKKKPVIVLTPGTARELRIPAGDILRVWRRRTAIEADALPLAAE